MKTRISDKQQLSIWTIVFTFVLFASGSTISNAQDRTISEVRSFLNEETEGRLTKAQLTTLAKVFDKNSNGIVTEAEFADKIDDIRKVIGQRKKGSDQTNSGLPLRIDNGKGKNTGKDTVSESKKPVVIPLLTNSSDATVLLITADEIAESWLPFAKWKTANGKATKIITVGQIAQQYKADNIQEKIRLCVQNHIDRHKTRWVVLGGDSLPDGKGLVPGGHTTVHKQERDGIPTDIVYLSKKNWDSDNDGIYGEFDDDRDSIAYPDGSVGLGRVPVRTADDVAAFTDKVIAYESKYPTSDFATRMIYTCTDKPAYPKVRNSWDGYLSKVWDGRMGRFFSKETPWDKEGKPGSHQLSAENLVELINSNKVGKFHIHGHGHLPAWVLESSTFTGKHVEQLKNDGAYPLITTVSCNTGEFDSQNDPSIVERMIRRPNGGSVAIVAPLRSGKPHFARRSDMRLMVTEGKLDGTTMTMTRFWTNGLGEGLTTGHAIMMAKADMASEAREAASYHLCICELNLLGDPTLDMRSKAPREPSVTVPKEISIGKHSIEILTDAPGSTVCLWKGTECYRVATADANGKVTMSIEPKTTGEISVSVSGANLNTSTGKIMVVSDASATNGN